MNASLTNQQRYNIVFVKLDAMFPLDFSGKREQIFIGELNDALMPFNESELNAGVKHLIQNYTGRSFPTIGKIVYHIRQAIESNQEVKSFDNMQLDDKQSKFSLHKKADAWLKSPQARDWIVNHFPFSGYICYLKKGSAPTSQDLSDQKAAHNRNLKSVEALKGKLSPSPIDNTLLSFWGTLQASEDKYLEKYDRYHSNPTTYAY